MSFRPMLGYGTTEMRCRQPADYLAEAGWRTAAGCIDSTLPRARHAIVLHRVRLSPLSLSVVRYARAHGLRLIYDIDDFVTGSDPDAFAEPIRALMEKVDLVTVSTSVLKERVDRFHPDCRVVRNGLSREVLDGVEAAAQAHRHRVGEVRIGYFSGSAHHDADLAAIAPHLVVLLRERPNAVLVIGGKITVPPELRAFGRRVRVEPFRPYREFVSLLGKVDINLAPLDLSCQFAMARSELKVIEAAAFGVPTVASPSPAYRDAIDHGRTGILCEDAGWASALKQLVDNGEQRRAMGAAARADVAERYGPDRCAKEWDGLISSVLSKPARARRPMPVRAVGTSRVAFHLVEQAGRRLVKGVR